MIAAGWLACKVSEDSIASGMLCVVLEPNIIFMDCIYLLDLLRVYVIPYYTESERAATNAKKSFSCKSPMEGQCQGKVFSSFFGSQTS